MPDSIDGGDHGAGRKRSAGAAPPANDSSLSMTLDSIREVTFVDVGDERGRLTAIEGGVHVPFHIARVFYVHRVADGVPRGGHAHTDTDQVVTAASGHLTLAVSDGVDWRRFDLDDPARGVYVPRMLWVDLLDFSDGAVCLVFASTVYDQSKSLRTWEDFLAAVCLPVDTPRWPAFAGERRADEPCE